MKDRTFVPFYIVENFKFDFFRKPGIGPSFERTGAFGISLYTNRNIRRWIFSWWGDFTGILLTIFTLR